MPKIDYKACHSREGGNLYWIPAFAGMTAPSVAF
jgi:hypothetical protein